MRRKEILLFGFVVIFSYAFAYTQTERSAIRLFLDPAAKLCANITNTTEAQVQAAKKTRDIFKINPCFFTCFLQKVSLIKEAMNKEVIDIPAAVLFATANIPTVKFNLLVDGIELLKCVAVFESSAEKDNVTALSCPKTREFLSCLIKQKSLLRDIILANRTQIF